MVRGAKINVLRPAKNNKNPVTVDFESGKYVQAIYKEGRYPNPIESPPITPKL